MQLSPINRFVEALVDALFSKAGRIRPPWAGLSGKHRRSREDRPDACRPPIRRRSTALAVHQLAVDRRMVELAKLMIGTGLIASSDINAMRIDLPNEDKYLFDWHQDYPYVLDLLDGIVFWVPLQDVDRENGRSRLALVRTNSACSRWWCRIQITAQTIEQNRCGSRILPSPKDIPKSNCPSNLATRWSSTRSWCTQAAQPFGGGAMHFAIPLWKFSSSCGDQSGWPKAMRDGSGVPYASSGPCHQEFG